MNRKNTMDIVGIFTDSADMNGNFKWTIAGWALFHVNSARINNDYCE